MTDFPPGYTSPPPPGAGGSPVSGPPSPSLTGAGGWQLAGWWPRVGAQVIDGLIVLAVALALLAPLGLFGAVGLDPGNEGGVLAWIGAFLLASVVIVAVAMIYAPILMARTNGQTIGRKALGIRVVRVSGRPITFGHAALREVVVKGGIWILSSATFGALWLVDVLWPLWDEEHRALHDFVTDTRTVKA